MKKTLIDKLNNEIKVGTEMSMVYKQGYLPFKVKKIISPQKLILQSKSYPDATKTVTLRKYGVWKPMNTVCPVFILKDYKQKNKILKKVKLFI